MLRPTRTAAHTTTPGTLATITADDDTAPTFVPVSMEVPELRVDTTDGYHPGLETIARFITQSD